MVWNNWSTRLLQEALEDIDKALLDDLEEIIPPLRGETFNPTELSNRGNLVEILSAFAPSDYFKKKENMRVCLERLPPKTLRNLVRYLSNNNLILSSGSFDEMVTNILSLRWSNQKFSTAFVQFFDLPTHFISPKAEPVPSYVDIEPVSGENPPLIPKPLKNLIDYQSQVYLDANKALEIPRSRFIVQMPTGSGKTRTSMEIIANHLKRSPPGEVVIWLAHSSELCEQAYQCFIEVWQYLADKPLKAVRCWGGHPAPQSFEKSMFIVGGFQKIHSLLKKDDQAFEMLSGRVGLIVVDEAHKAVAPTYKAAIQQLTGMNTSIIGLTATPGRTETEETAEMAEFFFESKVNIRTESGVSEIEMLKQRKNV